MEKNFDPGCLTLPEDLCDERDFKAEEAIDLDLSITLPESYSLWIWIYKTSYQWSLGACTALWTTHWVQILNVRKNGKVPSYSNILTPNWKDLWSKMWHSTTKYDGWDYVERAVNTALKEWIYIEENWEIARFDWYATDDWTKDDKCIDRMKRYLYQKDPIVWCVRWDKTLWNEMNLWRVRSIPKSTSQWHCIALVWRDQNWFWFINSWTANDYKKLKSRFYIDFEIMKKLSFNYRYRVLYIKDDEKLSHEYLKRKNNYVSILKTLREIYKEESPEMKKIIEQFSQSCRNNYKEINDEFPIN